MKTINTIMGIVSDQVYFSIHSDIQVKVWSRVRSRLRFQVYAVLFEQVNEE